jgi:hypothetical protein
MHLHLISHEPIQSLPSVTSYLGAEEKNVQQMYGRSVLETFIPTLPKTRPKRLRRCDATVRELALSTTLDKIQHSLGRSFRLLDEREVTAIIQQQKLRTLDSVMGHFSYLRRDDRILPPVDDEHR